MQKWIEQYFELARLQERTVQPMRLNSKAEYDRQLVGCKLVLLFATVCYQSSMAHCESAVHMNYAKCAIMLEIQFKTMLE